MGMRWGLGPVFAFESLLNARRRQVYAGRAFFVLVLFLGMVWIWIENVSIPIFPAGPAPTIKEMAGVGSGFFYALTTIQVSLVLLAAPAAAAGSIGIDMTVPFAAGALYSTVDDLLKWDRALATDQLLSKKSRDAMFTPFRGRDGYGWSIAQAFGHPMAAHGGGINGFATDIRRFPEDRVCIVVLSNVEGARVGEIGKDLAALVFGAGARGGENQGDKAGAAAAEAPGQPGEGP